MSKNIDLFTYAYIECALWSSNDNSRDDGGDPLNKNYSIEDLSNDCLEEMIKDCEDFQDKNKEDLSLAKYRHDEYTDSEMAGHDFWLTRNGHGAGFWDRRNQLSKELGKRLTKASKEFDECYLYVGDDKKIHMY